MLGHAERKKKRINNPMLGSKEHSLPMRIFFRCL
jgi:hypothetical protein